MTKQLATVRRMNFFFNWMCTPAEIGSGKGSDPPQLIEGWGETEEEKRILKFSSYNLKQPFLSVQNMYYNKAKIDIENGVDWTWVLFIFMELAFCCLSGVCMHYQQCKKNEPYDRGGRLFCYTLKYNCLSSVPILYLTPWSFHVTEVQACRISPCPASYVWLHTPHSR